jgi:ABC-type sugar transport system substrate-binding protein
MHPDDAGAGYVLARILLDRAKTLKANADHAVQIAGLTGDELSSVSAAREAGFRRAARENNATLHSVIGTSWRREVAERATATILEQHPDTSAIWTVTDPAALGVIDELKKRGLKPGVDVVTGGFDWSEQGIEAVRRGEMVATMGGHFMEGGWAMILAYDYHHGKDFADELGTTIFSSLQAVTPDNVDHHTDLFKQQDVDKIDFRELSKTYNSKLDKYDFSIENLLERLGDRKKVPAGER